jgi:sugar lactone lactonase YvrE
MTRSAPRILSELIAIAAGSAIVAIALDGSAWYALTAAVSASSAPERVLSSSDVFRLHAGFVWGAVAILLGLLAGFRTRPCPQTRSATWLLAGASLGVSLVLTLNGVDRATRAFDLSRSASALVAIGAVATAIELVVRRRTGRPPSSRAYALLLFCALSYASAHVLPRLVSLLHDPLHLIPSVLLGITIRDLAGAIRESLELLVGILLLGRLAGALAAPIGRAWIRRSTESRRGGGSLAIVGSLGILLFLTAGLLGAPRPVESVAILPQGGSIALAYGLHDGYRWPDGLAFDRERGLTVADEARGVVVVHRSGAAPAEWVSREDGLVSPEGVTWSPEGALVVSDDSGRRILRAPAPHEVQVVATSEDGLGSPEGVAFDDAGALFVGDEGTAEIVSFPPDGPRVVLADAATGLVAPEELAFDAHGRLWVTDDRGGSVIRYGPAGAVEVLEPVSSSLTEPEAVAIAPDGSVYVSDSQSGRIVRVRDDGTFVAVAQFRLPFGRVAGLAVGASGELFVSNPPYNIFVLEIPAEDDLTAFPEQGIRRIHVSTVTPHAATIHWVTETPEVDEVHAWTLDRRVTVASDPAPTRLHSVTLEGLEPSAVYHFLIRGAAGVSHLHHFQTLERLRGDRVLRFAVVADPQFDGAASSGGRKFAKVVDALNAAEVDFVLFPGDLVDNRNLEGAIPDFTNDARGYTKSFLEFKQIADGLRMPYFVAAGNHEKLDSPGTRESFYALFGLDRAYYSFDLGGQHFIVLEAVRSAGWRLDPAQLKWLAGDLDANRDRDVYVVVHYAVAADPFVFDADRGEMPEVQELLEAHGRVRVVYSGHKNTISAEIVEGILYVSSPIPTAGAHGYLIAEIYPSGMNQTFHHTPGAEHLRAPEASRHSRVVPEEIRGDDRYRLGRPEERNFTWRFGAPVLSTGAR